MLLHRCDGCWYLAGHFGTVSQVGHAHHAVPAVCRVLVHIFPEGFEPGGPCDTVMVERTHDGLKGQWVKSVSRKPGVCVLYSGQSQTEKHWLAANL